MREINVPVPPEPECYCNQEEWKEEKSREWHLIGQKAKEWVRKAKDKMTSHHAPFKAEIASWNTLPMELKELIWSFAEPANGGRTHELIPDPKQRKRPKRHLNRMVLRSNNTHVPSMLHVSNEWRAKALEIYQLCQYKPVLPHPEAWKVDHTCVQIKPFYFHKESDTLYLSKITAEWLGYVWARTDAIWVDNLFAGWRHVGLDYRSPSWVGRTPGHVPAPLETVFKKQPLILFREVFPSLQRLSIVIDLSEKNCPTPLENNVSLEDTSIDVSNWAVGRCIVSLWNMFLTLEYHDYEMPKLDFQEVARKQESAGWMDKYIRFYVRRSRLLQ